MKRQEGPRSANRTRWILAGGVSLAALAFFLSSPACAQDEVASTSKASQPEVTGSQALSVPDIVVTAQFQSQRLQDTPLAVSAVSGATLEAKGKANLVDLGGSAPNLTVEPTGDALGLPAAIFIRGIGQYDPNLAPEPGVSVYIDDIYYSTVLGTDFDLVDLDRIEVLRGPQGTLAAKNSIRGGRPREWMLSLCRNF